MSLNEKTDPGTNTDSCNKLSTHSSRVIDVAISELVLTPLTCANIVNEIIKCLIYQKSQIPYPFNWLKSVVNKKRSKEELEGEQRCKNFTVSNHYRQASSTYDNLDEMMTGLIKEFSSASSEIKEVILAFGTVPQCAQQVYSINIQNLAKGHVEKNHIKDSLKSQHKVLRNLFMSQSWMDSIDNELSIVNTYVFIRKHLLDTTQESKNDFFTLGQPFHSPRMAKKTTINLNYVSSVDRKCCDFEIFSEGSVESRSSDPTQVDSSIKDSEEFCWLEAKVPIKGFKDCFINKVSASELW